MVAKIIKYAINIISYCGNLNICQRTKLLIHRCINSHIEQYQSCGGRVYSNIARFFFLLTEITQEIIQEKIENIQKNLTVNKKETNQYIRTLTSAPDERQSAKNIGIVGVTVISVVFGVIMLSDCINVVKGIQNKCKRSEDS